MREIETDYLVVGAGASGMAFVDALIADSDADVVMVDRRHRPGGHWIDAYPFVRLHQPSANYGVLSRVLGGDRIDETGPNAGFYERATAAEICHYYERVLDEELLPSGQVRFFGMCDYQGSGPDGHRVVSNLTGETMTVKVRRRLVDATYMQSTVPSRHTPAFTVDPDVRFIPPNDLADVAGQTSGYTVLGAGKTAMDTCYWLLEQGVEPDRIRWVRPRDAWTMDRAGLQPLALVGSALEFQSRWTEAAAEAGSVTDLTHRLEAHGIMARLDQNVEPEVFRAAILSAGEREALRQIENVVRLGKVQRISGDRIILQGGAIPTDPNQVHVDCTAPGLSRNPARPVFDGDRITLQMVTFGVTPWSGATLGHLEATRENDEEKNRLGMPLSFDGTMAGFLPAMRVGMQAQALRMADADLTEWNERCRLNPYRGAMEHVDDPRVQAAMVRLLENMQPAIDNLATLVGEPSAV